MFRVSKTIRLVPYESYDKAVFEWYSNSELQWMVQGHTRLYTVNEIISMYDYQQKHGELYYIKYEVGDNLILVGDVWLSRSDFSIVISPKFQGQGIGKQVVGFLLNYVRHKGWDKLVVGEVYRWNESSNHLFQSLGFKRVKETEKGYSYVYFLQKEKE